MENNKARKDRWVVFFACNACPCARASGLVVWGGWKQTPSCHWWDHQQNSSFCNRQEDY